MTAQNVKAPVGVLAMQPSKRNKKDHAASKQPSEQQSRPNHGCRASLVWTARACTPFAEGNDATSDDGSSLIEASHILRLFLDPRVNLQQNPPMGTPAMTVGPRQSVDRQLLLISPLISLSSSPILYLSTRLSVIRDHAAYLAVSTPHSAHLPRVSIYHMMTGKS